MVFTQFVLQAVQLGFEQILLPSIAFRDFKGTSKLVPFEDVFDALHWNSYYPALPRLVKFDPVQHADWNPKLSRFFQPIHAIRNLTHPYALGGDMTQLLKDYMNYTTMADRSSTSLLDKSRSVEQLILREALRPHPNVRAHMKRLSPNHSAQKTYMVLHARVEPDMQNHPYCQWAKVRNLSTIFSQLQAHFPTPPADELWIAINRKLLEQDSQKDPLVTDNLNTLNNVHALWNGRVPVREAGIGSLQNTTFAQRPGLFGSLVDYFWAVDAKVFVGTEVSSFSMDIVSTRFYRNNKANYLYYPDGIQRATPNHLDKPPRFRC